MPVLLTWSTASRGGISYAAHMRFKAAICGNPGCSDGVAMGAGQHRGDTGTSELIGEDLSAIISLDASQLMR